MRHINPYPVFPSGYRKKESGFGPLSGPLIEKYDARAVFDPHDLTVAGNPWGVPIFFWHDGNGTTPDIGPAGTTLTETGAGALIPGSPTPYQYASGVDVTGERYDGVNYRTDTTRRLAPTDTNDIVVVVKLRADNVNHGGGGGWTDIYFGTVPWRTNNGFFVGVVNGSFSFYYSRYTVFAEQSVTMGTQYTRTQNLLIGLVDRSATTMVGFCNGVLGTTNNAVPVGAISGTGISIGAGTDGSKIAGAGMQAEWIAVWFADDIYGTWRADSDRLIKRLSMESLGLRETVTNSKYWFYSQAGGGSGNYSGGSALDHNGRWYFTGRRTPRAGNSRGCIVSPYKNNVAAASGGLYNYDVTAGAPATWTATGGVFTRVDDTAALAAAKAETWGPYVYSFTNATGVPQTVYCGSNRLIYAYTFFLLARYVAGANAQIGWYNTVGGVFTSVGTVLDAYALTRIMAQTPANATSRFAVQIPDGCELYFIGQDLSGYSLGYSRFSYPIPYREAPWSNESQREILTTEHTPVAGQGSYLVNLAPLAWSGTECGLDNSVLPCVTTAGDILHAESAASGWATSDGTVQIATGAPVAGTYVNVWTAWKAALQYIQQGLVGVATVGAYDGAKGTAGAMQFAPSIYGGEYAVKTIEIRNVA